MAGRIGGLLLMVALGAMPGRAQSEWLVDDVKIVGNGSYRSAVLFDKMQQRPSRVFRPTEFSLEELGEDVATLEAFYHQRGYFQAVVGIEEIIRDTSEMLVNLVLSVREGPRARIDTIQVIGERDPDGGDLQEMIPLNNGAPLDSSKIAQAAEKLEQKIARQGYLFANVSERIVIESNAVVFFVDRGPRVVAGELIVPDDITVSGRVIRRALRFQSGDTLTTGVLRNSVAALYATELFSFAALNPVDTTAGDPDILVAPVELQLQQADMIGLQVLAGYDAFEEFFGRVRVAFRNLFDRGHRLNFTVRASSAHQRGEVGYVYPGFFLAPLEADVSLYVNRRDQQAFTGTFLGGEVGVSGQIGANNGFRVWGNLEQATRLDDRVDPVAREAALVLWGARISRDTRPEEAGGGLFAQGQAEIAGPGVSWSYHFYRLLAELRGYYGFQRRHMSLSSAALVAYVDSYGERNAIVPPHELLWIGFGAIRSIRGFDPSDVSPVSDEGLVEGGKFALIFNPVEFRFPLFWWFSGALFVDGGLVWSEGNQADISDLKWALGSGIRLHLPMGTLRLDYGMEINEDPGFGGRAHLGIGVPF